MYRTETLPSINAVTLELYTYGAKVSPLNDSETLELYIYGARDFSYSLVYAALYVHMEM